MDASILVVGEDDFLATLLEYILDRTAFAIGVASNPAEAIPLIHAQQPDLLILQAKQTDSLDLCRQLKAQSRLAWIYCILLDEPTSHKGEHAQLWNQQIELNTRALEAGADAYLWLSTQLGNGSDGKQVITLQNRLLHAQLQAGLHRIQNHRELIRTNDLLSAIALSDPLTELNNRRAFEWELPRQVQNARSRDTPLSLLMLDVDHFKSINDSYGHLVGDCALQVLAARLRHNLRFYDTLFRYGGEEFVIILSNTDAEEAPLIAYRLCHLVGSQPFNINASLDLKITISAGTASLRLKDDTKGISLLHRADQNLLRAKSAGRNRVISSNDLEI